MRNLALVSVLCPALLLLPGCMTSPFHEGNRFDTTVMADFGWRCADNDLEPVDEQHAFGLEADIRLPHDQTGLEVGVFHSYRDGKNNGIDVSSSMTEASVGGRWVYGSPWLLGAEPYATAGASLIFLSNETDYGGDASQSATDWTVGPYIRLGLQWTFAEHLTFALDYRQVMFTDWFRDIHLDDLTTDANYSQVGVVLGWKF